MRVQNRIQNINGIKAQFSTRAKGYQGNSPDNDCTLPQNPFPKINASNTASWYEGVSNFLSGLMDTEACVESSTTDGILTNNPNYNPQEAIHKKFQIAALIRKSYGLLKEVIEKQEEFLKSLKDTHNSALAAK